MLLVDRLASFRRRRIDLPVGRRDLVLDVGSGDKPSWRADVLLDGFPEAEHAAQRSGSSAAAVERPLFAADAAAMPFADQAFDYVICSHVLEHVEDPAAVVSELTRVARAGYIEVPLAASSRIWDFPSHLWWCRLEGQTLVLTGKEQPWADREIHDHLVATGLDRPLDDLLNNTYFHLNAISLWWTGSVDLRVEGTPSAAVLAHARDTDARHHEGRALAARTLTTGLTLGRRPRGRAVRYDDVVRPELRRGDGRLLEDRVYDLRDAGREPRG